MIITVTMNPAIDKTVDIGDFEHGGLNRIQRVVLDAGGKGINVSRTVKELGGTTIATGFLAGNSGAVIETMLESYGIRADFVHVCGETRTNMKVVEQNGTVTELNEPGPSVTLEQTEELIAKLEAYADADTLFVLAGSVPRGIDKDIYRVITEKVHAKGASVLVDADGELLVRALEAVPEMVKPNRAELEEYFHFAHTADRAELIQLGCRLLDQGIGLAAVSMGPEGALFLGKERKYSAPGLTVKTHSTVGAGDAMAAALAYGWDQRWPLEKSASLGMAVSAGAVTTLGTKPSAREIVEELLKQVQLEEISDV